MPKPVVESEAGFTPKRQRASCGAPTSGGIAVAEAPLTRIGRMRVSGKSLVPGIHRGIWWQARSLLTVLDQREPMGLIVTVGACLLMPLLIGIDPFITALGFVIAVRVGYPVTESFKGVAESNFTLVILLVAFLIEEIADYIPLANHANDACVQIWMRPLVGIVVLFAAASKLDSWVMQCVVSAYGGGGALAAHVVRAGTFRPAVSVGTASLGNPIAAFIEDLIVIVVMGIVVMSIYLVFKG